MPVELPHDVWFYIVKNFIDVEKGKSELANLASTNKHIREVAVPMLYEWLVFMPSSQSHPRALRHPMQWIHRGRDRVLSLQNCPHLLYHVRRLEIYDWSSIIRTREEVLLEEEMYDLESGEEIEYQEEEVLSGLWSVLYDIVTNLVSEMPRLKTLTILESPITLRLHSAFSRIPTLERLELNGCKVPDARLAAGLIEAHPLVIKELQYEWLIPNTTPAPYFQRILESCLPFLTSLDTDGVDISLILEVAGNRRLPLRTLEMSHFFPFGDKPREICAFLMACPDLRVVRLKDGDNMDMGELQGGLLHLESVSGSPNVVRQLTSGRPVHEVEFPYSAAAGPADFEARWSPSVPIRQVCVGHLSHCLSGEHVVKNIKSMIRAFPQVTHITVKFTYVTIEREVLASRTKDLPHSDLLFQKLQEVMVRSIAQWPELRYCRLLSSTSIDLDESITEELAECPIAPRGNPNKRGHLTLQEVQLCSRFIWIWIPGEGWVPENQEIEV